MDAVEMEAAPSFVQDYKEDFSSVVLAQFSNSDNEHHLHICAAIGAMSQELRDQTLPLTPITYFGATCSSLDRLSSSVDPSGHLLDALLTILSLVINKISPAVLKSKYVYLSTLLIQILRVKSIGVNGVNPGLLCASRLLMVREKMEWAEVEQLYGVLISYITDDRPKVRKQSHSCLREVLGHLQLVPALASAASEAITNVFERFLLLAGGSNGNVPEGSKAAQEVLYILDALKICLPYMSSKSTANILKYFKSLLELKHPLVTRRITDGLNALCLHSSGEISAEGLLDLLCFLAASVSQNETSADSMTFIARLLDNGMKRVFSLNREICLVKLPSVFNALKDVLASGHEEALVAAVATCKSLIHSCIDEGLIKQSVDQVTTGANSATRKSGPTVIEKVCATIESLLDYQHEAVWDMSFQIVTTIFDKLGKYSFYFLTGTMKSLVDLQNLPDGEFAFRKQLHECMGTALGAMGPENFLSLIPLHLDVPDLSESNLWLFPILKQYTVGAHLNFFTNSILPMVRLMKQKAAVFEREGKLHSARSVTGIVYSLWSLLPSFCNYPVDTAESFKGLEKALCTALQEEPEVRGIICSSLQILIQQNKGALEGKGGNLDAEAGIAEQRAVALYTKDIAGSNLSTLKSSARELFSVLAGVYSKVSKDTVGILQCTIRELASISDKEVVTSFYLKTMKKLLIVTRKASKSKDSKNSNLMQVDNSNEGSVSAARAQLFDIAVSLLPGLDSKEIDALFSAVQPALKDDDFLIQKKAYRVLSMIFQYSDDFISRKLEVLLTLMIEVLPSCHFSAKRHRLDCLYFLIVHVSKEGSEQKRHITTASFLTEIILALKEANKKTRTRAYDILVQIGHSCGDEEKGGKKENLLQYFYMVAGGLAGETPHKISAAMTGLARLAYEFSDLVSAAYSVLPSTYLLMQRKNKEIIKEVKHVVDQDTVTSSQLDVTSYSRLQTKMSNNKKLLDSFQFVKVDLTKSEANLGLLKVLVAKSPAEGLQTHLRGMVEGLLNWQDSTRSLFKAKVKLLLEMLVKKCGLDAVKEVMPEEHMKLLTNIRKLSDRKERKLNVKSIEDRSILSKATTSRLSRWNHTKIFSDFEDDETRNSDGEFGNKRSISSRHSKYSSALQSKASLLRSKKTRRAAKSLQEDVFDQLDDEPLDMLDRQKMRSALRSSHPVQTKSDSDDEPCIDPEGRLIIQEDGKNRRVDRKHKREDTEEVDGRSEAGSRLSENSRKTQKRRKTSETGWAHTGKEYKSKKAGGDLRRKDKLEPYAYWPLDRKMVSKRPEHRAAARKGMQSVVKLTKKFEGKSASNALSSFKKGKKKGGQKGA